MSQKKRRSQDVARHKSGFTLVEIMLVVVIISVLLSIAAVNLGGQGKKSNIVKAKATIMTLSTAIDMYEMDFSKYPATLEDLISNPKNKVYLKKKFVPKDPWDKPFTYTVPGANNTHSYDISTEFDGESINNWEE